MNIAVLIDKDDNVISFDQPGVIKVYSKEAEGWLVKKEFPFGIDTSVGMKSVRESIREMAEKLDGCKVFAAEDVTGLTYNILESMDFNIWRVSGKTEEFLD